MLNINQVYDKLKKTDLYNIDNYSDLAEIVDAITIYIQNHPDEADKYRGSVEYITKVLTVNNTNPLTLELSQALLRVNYEINAKLCLLLLVTYFIVPEGSNNKTPTLYDAFKTTLSMYRQPKVQDVYKYFVMQYWESMKLARVDQYIGFFDDLIHNYNIDFGVVI